MKVSYVACLLLVAALAAVWANRQVVEVRAPSRVFAEQGYNLRFNFGIRSLDRNVSLNESLVQVTKFNATELPEAFQYKVWTKTDDVSGATSRIVGKASIMNATCEHVGKYVIFYGDKRWGKAATKVSIKGCGHH